MKKITPILVAIFIAFTGIVVVSPDAQAGPFCKATLICGHITNATGVGITISMNWSDYRYNRRLLNGKNTTQFGNDADGFYAPWPIKVQARFQGYWQEIYRTGKGWQKINDTQQIRIVR